MAALQYVDVPGYAALILRRTFAELEQPNNVIPISMDWFGQAPENVRPRYNSTDHEWRFPSGAVIRFGHLDHPDAMVRYQGGGYHFVGFDELTHFSERPYEFISFSRQRRPPEGPLSKVPMRVRSTGNPGGVGHMWVKRRFIDNRKPGVIFVPAKLSDNPGIDQEDYRSRLELMDSVFVQQLLDGDWGAFEGAAYRIEDDIHFISPFEIPDAFDRFESMDYGLNAPTAWLAWAVDYEGNLIVYDEYYKPGLPSETAPVILARRNALWKSSLAYGDPNSLAMRTGGKRRWGEPETIESLFADEGLHIVRANNNPRAGYAQLRQWLKIEPDRYFPDWHPRHGEKGAPQMFVVSESCPNLSEQLKTAPLVPIERRHAGEMVDPDWEGPHGHAHAACRYGALSRPEASAPPEKQEPEDPRAALLWRHEKNVEKRSRLGRFVHV